MDEPAVRPAANRRTHGAGAGLDLISAAIEYPMNAQPTSAPLSACATPDFLAPVFTQYPLTVVGAEGVWLHSSDGCWGSTHGTNSDASVVFETSLALS